MDRCRAYPGRPGPDWKPALAVIGPEPFSSAGAKKTRMDWFCYELSLAIYDNIISETLGGRLIGFGIDENALADFSVRLARDAKVQIIDWLEGRSKAISYSEEKIGTFLPTLDSGTAKELFDAVLDAWDSLLAICGSCPNACITRRDEPAPMFDGGGRDDYPWRLLETGTRPRRSMARRYGLRAPGE